MNENTPVFDDSLNLPDLVDWGNIRTMIEGESRTSGRVLHKDANGERECGVWVCTPGKWKCTVTNDEFCHFLKGRCTYIRDDGETIEVTSGTTAYFPRGWSGECTVHETVRKVYMIP